MPENTIYYQLAYAATIVLYVGYALSIVVRRRAIKNSRQRPPGSD